MGVTVGDVDALMSHTLCHGQGDKAHVDQQTDVTMPLWYNCDKPEKLRISRVLRFSGGFFILFQTEKSSRDVIEAQEVLY